MTILPALIAWACAAVAIASAVGARRCLRRLRALVAAREAELDVLAQLELGMTEQLARLQRADLERAVRVSLN